MTVDHFESMLSNERLVDEDDLGVEYEWFKRDGRAADAEREAQCTLEPVAQSPWEEPSHLHGVHVHRVHVHRVNVHGVHVHGVHGVHGVHMHGCICIGCMCMGCMCGGACA